MKKTTFKLSLAIPILFLIVSCNNLNSDLDSSKSYSVTDFSSLDLEVIGDVYYEQADTFYLSAIGNSKLIKDLKVSDKKGLLSIQLKNKKKFSGDRKGLIIRVGSPTLESVNFNGIGTLNLEHYFKSDQLKITHNGVGKIKIDDCHVGVFNLTSKAIGSIAIKGKSNETFINSKGVGQIDCSEFLSMKTTVVSSGVGNISVYAQNSLDISLTGVGNVKYYGKPPKVKSDISEVGKATNMNP